MDSILQTSLELTGKVAGMIWWPTNIVLLFMVGILLSIQTRAIQFRQLIFGIKLLLRSKNVDGPGEISPFAALMTALAGTVGNGNIAGVATAIAAGGPGAVFWMWISALLGMSTKYSEALLGRLYRKKEGEHFYGGPMYYIEKLKTVIPFAGVLSFWYAVAIMLVGSIGSGNMAQSNSIALALESQFSVSPLITATVVVVLVGIILLGGIKRIAQVSEKLVPAMILLYVGASITIVFTKWEMIPEVFGLILSSAFQGEAALGGAAGYSVRSAMQLGVSRGVLSNESGLGTCAIPAAAAQGRESVPQAIIAMMGSFIDTIIVCSMTAFIIISSGHFIDSDLTSVALTKTAFAEGLGDQIGAILVSVCSIVFGFSTIIAFAYYSEQGFHYIFPNKSRVPLRLFITLASGAGALLQGQYLGIVWNLSDIANGLMVFPNLIALLFFTKVVKRETKAYFAKWDNGELDNPFG